MYCGGMKRAIARPETLQEAIVFFSEYENCHRTVVAIRWPDGVVRCPTCGSDHVTYLASQRRWKCYAKHAKPQFSLKVGTLFEDSPLGLESGCLPFGSSLTARPESAVTNSERHSGLLSRPRGSCCRGS